MAHRRWVAFRDAHPDVPCYEVHVIESRAVSDLIAARLDVQHESPQAIVVRDGVSVWDGSHFQITADELAAAWSTE